MLKDLRLHDFEGIIFMQVCAQGRSREEDRSLVPIVDVVRRPYSTTDHNSEDHERNKTEADDLFHSVSFRVTADPGSGSRACSCCRSLHLRRANQYGTSLKPCRPCWSWSRSRGA